MRAETTIDRGNVGTVVSDALTSTSAGGCIRWRSCTRRIIIIIIIIIAAERRKVITRTRRRRRMC